MLTGKRVRTATICLVVCAEVLVASGTAVRSLHAAASLPKANTIQQVHSLYDALAQAGALLQQARDSVLRQALPLLWGALTEARERRMPEAEAAALLMMAQYYLLSGELDSVPYYTDASQEIAEREGYHDTLIWIALTRMNRLAQMGQYDSVLATANAVMPQVDSLITAQPGVELFSLLSTVLERVGRKREAIAALRRSVRYSILAGDTTTVGWSSLRLARLYEDLGHGDSARAEYTIAMGAAYLIRDSVLALVATAGLTDAYADAGIADSAMLVANMAGGLARAVGTPLQRSQGFNAVAIAYDAQGRSDSALRYVEIAVAEVDRWNPDSVPPYLLVNLGLGLWKRSEYDSAAAVLLHAYEQALSMADTVAADAALVGLGNVSAETGELVKAREYWTEALELARLSAGDTVPAISNLGMLYARVDLDSALAYLRVAAAALEPEGRLGLLTQTWGGLAHAFLKAGFADSALSYYERIFEHDIADNRTLTELLNSFALLQYGIGYYDATLETLRGTVELSREARFERVRVQATLSMGRVFSELGWPDSAMTYSREALSVAEETGTLLSDALSAMAQLHFRMGRPDSAIAYGRRALELEKAVGDHAHAAITLANLGVAYLKSGMLDSARAVLQEAAVLADGSSDIPTRVAVHVAQSAVWYAEGKLDSMLVRLETALQEARQTFDGRAEASILVELGVAHQSRGDREGILKAAAYYDSAATKLGRLRGGLQQDVWKATFLDTGAELFDHWVLAELARAELGEADGLAAVRAAERGRSQALLDLMQRADRARGVGAVRTVGQLVNEAGAMRSAILYYHSTGDTLVTWALRAGHAPVTHRAPVGRDSLASLTVAIRAALGADDAMGRARLRGTPTGRLQQADAPTQAERDRLTKLLSDLLVPPEVDRWSAEVDELVVVTDGSLAAIPFAILHAPSGAMLVERYALRYTPSLALLSGPGMHDADTRLGGSTASRALVVANPNMPTLMLDGVRIRLSPLPGAEDEGQYVASRLSTNPLIGGSATEDTVRTLMADASVIHIASHALAFGSKARSQSTFVALAPDEKHDGILTVGELVSPMEARLNAQLVVLSACQTGLGEVTRSEGILGLQRAFLARGARAVLVSLWSVSDEATRELMTGFYNHWLDDADRPSKAEALRRAQMDVRATPGFEHPVYWAGFHLVGGR